MIDAIDSKEDGHLNKMEVEALFRHLSETETTLDEAWQMCLLDINENHFRTRKNKILFLCIDLFRLFYIYKPF